MQFEELDRLRSMLKSRLQEKYGVTGNVLIVTPTIELLMHEHPRLCGDALVELYVTASHFWMGPWTIPLRLQTDRRVPQAADGVVSQLDAYLTSTCTHGFHA